MIDQLKNLLGTRLTSVWVNDESAKEFSPYRHGVRFCEAVHLSFNHPIKLISENVICPGARRSLGFYRNDKDLAQFISGNNAIPVEFIEGALEEIPKLSQIDSVILGMDRENEQARNPDLLIAYVKPEVITRIMHQLAREKRKARISPFSLLSVCGNVFANCYLNNRISVSFGCPESRRYGGVENDEVIIGIPYSEVHLLACSAG